MGSFFMLVNHRPTMTDKSRSINFFHNDGSLHGLSDLGKQVFATLRRRHF